MVYRTIPETDLLLSVIGYGGWGAGVKGWPDVSEKKVCESIEEALKWGINLFDTSPLYGNGKSEAILGTMLAGFRKYIVLSTKFGLVEPSPGKIVHDISRDSMLRELEESLKRLKTDYIDIYTVHYPDEKTDLSTVYEELKKLKGQGIIKHFGVSNHEYDQVELAVSAGAAVVQNRFNYVAQGDKQKIIPYCEKYGAGYFAYSPLSQGLLTDKIGKEYVPGKKEVRRLNPVFSDAGIFKTALAARDELGSDPLVESLNFVLNTPGVTSALITMTRPEHVRRNAEIAVSVTENKDVG